VWNRANSFGIGAGLQQIKLEDLAAGFQHSETNPMLGIEERVALLNGLGKSLHAQPDVFGKEGRPGNIVGESLAPAKIIAPTD
jgi:hypothetical protein